VNRSNVYEKSGVIRSTISDHDLIYTVKKINNKVKKIYETRIVRDFKNINQDDTIRSISDAPWWSIEQTDDIENKFELFCEIMKIILNKHAPVKKVRTKITKPLWMTKEYTASIHQINKLKREAIKLNTPAAWLEFRRKRIAAKTMRNKLKLQSITTAINDHDNQSKIAWKVFNDETGKTKTNGIITKLSCDKQLIEDPKVIANKMCEYYTTCANKIKSSEPQCGNEEEHNEIKNELSDIVITEEDVLYGIKYLK